MSFADGFRFGLGFLAATALPFAILVGGVLMLAVARGVQRALKDPALRWHLEREKIVREAEGKR